MAITKEHFSPNLNKWAPCVAENCRFGEAQHRFVDSATGFLTLPPSSEARQVFKKAFTEDLYEAWIAGQSDGKGAGESTPLGDAIADAYAEYRNHSSSYNHAVKRIETLLSADDREMLEIALDVRGATELENEADYLQHFDIVAEDQYDKIIITADEKIDLAKKAIRANAAEQTLRSLLHSETRPDVLNRMIQEVESREIHSLSDNIITEMEVEAALKAGYTQSLPDGLNLP